MTVSTNDIHIIGGRDEKGLLSSVEFVEPGVIGKWKMARELPFPLADTAAVADHSDVYIFGGITRVNGVEEPLDVVLRLADNGWIKIGKLLRKRAAHRNGYLFQVWFIFRPLVLKSKICF